MKKPAINLYSVLLALPLVTSTVACNQTRFSSMDEAASFATSAPQSGASDSQAIGESATQQTSAGLVSSNPKTSGIYVTNDDIPFSFAMNTDECVDYDGDNIKFELIKDDTGLIRDAQITQLASTESGDFDYGSYGLYALYADENGKLYSPDSIYAEVTVADQRAYGAYNCLIQNSYIKDAADRADVQWKDVPSVAKLHFKVSYEQHLVGFVLKNKSTNALTMRCYK